MEELVVSVKDQPGEMDKIAEAFGENGVNIMAVALFTLKGEGRIHMVVSDIKKGKKVLEGLKYKPTVGEVLILELKHSPGELARVTKALAAAKINIELLYGSGSTYPSAQMVMGVSNLKKAEKVLGLD
jgi:hypothetical protein